MISPRPVGTALIGPNGFGRERLRAAYASSAVEVVAVCPAPQSPVVGCASYDRLDDLLAHPGIEAVIICAPTPHHPALGMAALAADMHVFIEKPLADTVREAAELVRAAAARDRRLAVGHNSRRAAHARAMRRMLDDGTLGRVVMAEAHFSRDAGLRLTPDQWRWSVSTCPGGPLSLLGIHEVDTLQYLLGPAVSVFGWQCRLATPAEIPDTTVTALAFESGALASIGANYSSPPVRALRLYGTRSSARWEDGSGLVLDPPGGPPEPIPLPAVDTLREELDDFAASIREGRALEVDGICGMLNVAVVEAAIEASRTGRAVEVRAVLDRAGTLDLVDAPLLHPP